MSYATSADLSGRMGPTIFTEIYDPLPAGTSDGDLESAAAEIDGALAFRYRLPVAGTRSMALLKDWNLTLAEERAFARPIGGDFAEKVKSRVAQVRQFLSMIRNDEFRLPDAEENSDSGAGMSVVQNDDPVFGRDRMNGF